MAHVVDLWHTTDPVTGKAVRTARYGQGRRWLARYIAPNGGRPSRSFDRKLDAERFLATVETDKLRGTYVDPAAGRETVKSYAQRWLSMQVHRGNTADLYRTYLTNHIYPVLGSHVLAAVKRSDVQALVKGLVTKGLAASTIEVIYGIVATIFRAAVEDERLARTPCRAISLPEVITRRLVALPRAQVLALPDAVPKELRRFRAPIMLGMSSGLRQGEVFGVQVDRLDFLRRQVTVDAIRGQLSVRGGARIVPPKTKASARTVPLPDMAIEMLAAHMAEFPPYDRHFPECERGRCADGCLYGLVFTSTRGGPIRKSAFNPGVWHDAVEAAGLPTGTGFHELRHFYASVLIDGGESVKVVQARLGHGDATETLNTYAHWWPDSEDRTRAVVEAALCPEDEATELSAETGQP